MSGTVESNLPNLIILSLTFGQCCLVDLRMEVWEKQDILTIKPLIYLAQRGLSSTWRNHWWPQRSWHHFLLPVASLVAACHWVTSWSSSSTSQPTRFRWIRHWLHDLISTSLYIEIASNQDKCCLSTASQCLHQKMLPPLCSTHSTLLMWRSAECPLLFLHTLILRSNRRKENPDSQLNTAFLHLSCATS